MLHWSACSLNKYFSNRFLHPLGLVSPEPPISRGLSQCDAKDILQWSGAVFFAIETNISHVFFMRHWYVEHGNSTKKKLVCFFSGILLEFSFAAKRAQRGGTGMHFSSEIDVGVPITKFCVSCEHIWGWKSKAKKKEGGKLGTQTKRVIGGKIFWGKKLLLVTAAKLKNAFNVAECSRETEREALWKSIYLCLPMFMLKCGFFFASSRTHFPLSGRKLSTWIQWKSVRGEK